MDQNKNISGFDEFDHITPKDDQPFATPSFNNTDADESNIETFTDTAKSPDTEETELGSPFSVQNSNDPTLNAEIEKQPPAIDEHSYTPNAHYGFFPSGNYGDNQNTPQADPSKNSYPVYPTPPTPKPPKVPRAKKPFNTSAKFTMVALLISVLVAAIVGASAGIGSYYIIAGNPNLSPSPSSTNSQPSEDEGSIKNIVITGEVESVVEAVYEKSGPSVVGIRTTIAVQNFFGNSSSSTGEGSGIIYSSDGYIITNYHVISDSSGTGIASKIEVFMADAPSTGVIATVVGYNIASDLAVLKVDKTGLRAIDFADSSSVKVGQYAVAIGSPGGLQFMGSVSYGIVSGLDREIDVESSSMKLIQTDAAINPGNSGGALCNTKGELIGVNSAKFVDESVEGMGFAIPSATVKEICDSIIAHKNDPSPYIGLEVSTRYSSSTLQMLGYPNGAVIQNVVKDSPADRSGLQRGDIITEFNGKTINDFNDYGDAAAECVPNTVISVKLYRSGKYFTASITVGANNSQ